MGRKRLPEGERRDPVHLRLPRWMIDKIENEGKIQDVIEKILSKIYKKEK